MASGRTRLHPADWAPGGHQRPEELPWPSRVSLERVSSYDPKAAEPHRRHGGWRHPPPSGSPSGPVGPSGRNSNPDFPVQPRRPLGAKRNLEGGRGRVKAMFPLARRVCPAQDGRITSMEFPVMSRASGQARPGAHRFAGTATGAMARMFAAWSRVRRSKQPAAYARKVLLNRHLLERPSSRGPSRQASRVIAAGTARWSHPQVRISGRGGQLPGTYQGRRGPRPLRGASRPRPPKPPPPPAAALPPPAPPPPGGEATWAGSMGRPERRRRRTGGTEIRARSPWAARCRIKPTTKVRPNSRTRPLAPTTWAY